jgi:pimeloyl-ACP methyl ester carboxylesterase
MKMMRTCIYSAAVTVAAMAAAVLLTSCLFRDLEKEVAGYDASYALVGQVDDPSGRQDKVVVILFTEQDGKKIPIQYGFPEKTGHFSFLVQKGVYYLGAFEDRNENLRHDTGESAGYFGAPDKIVTPELPPDQKTGKTISNLNIRLLPVSAFVDGFDVTSALEIEQMPVFRAGVIAKLEDAVFDDENGSTGYWKPLSFIKQFGVGIYFLEPYDPRRIPVLFVHGATGTPRGWGNMVSHLDKQRYQAWFYYYPSGIRLDAVANALNGIIQALHDQYRFDRLYITAHSMGGLVSRAAILTNRYRYHQDYIKLFISLSTPWGGIRMAQKGVEKAPAAIPSWNDVTPDSDFIRSIFSQSLAPDVPFHLFFSHKGDCSLFMENNDGTVELDSELDYRAQSDAAGIYGFNEDHGSILESSEMIDRYLGVLEALAKD